MNAVEQGPDFVVSALISELKAENDRKSRTIHALMKIIYSCLVTILLVIGGFLWYLNQYDFISESTTTTTTQLKPSASRTTLSSTTTLQRTSLKTPMQSL